MNTSPFCVLRTFPGCGSPCSSCSAAPRSPTACRRSRRVPVRSSRSWVGERRRAVSARDEPLGVRDSIREVRRRDVKPSHAHMQPLEGIRVVGWRDVLRCPGRVVGPERHCEAVTLVDARLDVRLESGHGGLGLSEHPSEVDFALEHFMACTRDSSKDVAWQQAQGDLVRVLNHDRVVSWQVELCSSRDRGRHRTRDVRCLHDFTRRAAPRSSPRP